MGGRTAADPVGLLPRDGGVLTASGAVVPGAVAVVAPIGIGFALRYGINPLLMGLMIINGATAGGFSPISVFGSIVNGVVEREDLAGERAAAVRQLVHLQLPAEHRRLLPLRRAELLGRRVEPGEAPEGESMRRFEREQKEKAATARAGRPPVAGGAATAAAAEVPELDRDKILTLIGIVSLIVVALAFDVDVGFVALTIAAVLSLISPASTKGAVNKVAWPTVLLICGIVMYVGLLENIGTIDWLGEQVATISAALIAALLICYVGGIVSAFASTTGILGALIPLAVPFLETGAVGAVGMIIALSIASSVVDSSPFSTSGALTVANTPEEKREFVFKRLMQWGMTMVLIAPPIAWLVFVVPGWL